MECFVGVDVGSAFSKGAVLIDNKNISYHIIPSGGNYESAAEEAIREALGKANLSLRDVAYTVATGYGAHNLPLANQVITDITCQARGISRLFPSARTIIDIGDMFTRVIKVDDRGRAISFLTSGKCAGGSGRVLQMVAHVLQVPVEEIGELSLKSKQRIDFNTGCAVFAETEVISRVAEGTSKEDLLAGLHRALAAQIQSLVERVGVEDDCALVGGGAKNIGLVRSLEEALGVELLVPEEPQMIAAFGAGLIARERIVQGVRG
jgi:predicted CoA-substrate-specific enzyme activase